MHPLFDTLLISFGPDKDNDLENTQSAESLHFEMYALVKFCAIFCKILRVKISHLQIICRMSRQKVFLIWSCKMRNGCTKRRKRFRDFKSSITEHEKIRCRQFHSSKNITDAKCQMYWRFSALNDTNIFVCLIKLIELVMSGHRMTNDIWTYHQQFRL